MADRLLHRFAGNRLAQAMAEKLGLRPLWGTWRQWSNGLRHLNRQGVLIRQYDREIKRRLRDQPMSPLWRNGYFAYPKAPPHILNSAREMANDEKFVLDTRALPVISYLVNLVRNDVVEYIGQDVRLDDIYINRIPESSHKYASVSGSWHTDNVGHRLKVFFCIEGYGDVPTCYRPGTNRRSFRPSARQHMRFLGRFDYSRRFGEVRLNYTTGDIFIFDTNGQHRGGYDQSHRKRTVLLMEFADRRKSERLEGVPIGPGRGFSLSRAVADAHAQELLLDPALLLPETEDTYRYARRS